MTRTHLAVIGLAWAVAMPGILAGPAAVQGGSAVLVEEVRQATREFRDPAVAMAAGYGSTGSCVSGPEVGAMGVHFANGALIGDAAVDAQHPELLIYEHRGGRMRLVGVEFLVIAAAWDAGNAAPPVLMGQHFQYVGSPVSCAEYTGEDHAAH